MCEDQHICNPEDCHKCRSERKLPSVSLLLTFSATLTIFLMHNYPDTHTPGGCFFPMTLPQLLNSNPIFSDYKIGLHTSRHQETFQKADTRSVQHYFSWSIRTGFCCRMNHKSPFWVNLLLIVLSMTFFSCFHWFSCFFNIHPQLWLNRYLDI